MEMAASSPKLQNPKPQSAWAHCLAAAMASDLPACKYGSKCTRKNPTHFQQFSHPSGSDEGSPKAGKKRTHSAAMSDDEATLPMPLKKANTAVLSDDDDETEYLTGEGSSGTGAAVVEPASARRPCKYGAGCYRREKTHKAEFSHPGDADYLSSDEDLSSESSSSAEDVDMGVEWAPSKPKRRRRKKAAGAKKAPVKRAAMKAAKTGTKMATAASAKTGGIAPPSDDEEDEEVAPTAMTAKGKQDCPFGADCLRTSKFHREQFSHPSSAVPLQPSKGTSKQKSVPKAVQHDDDDDNDDDDDDVESGNSLKGQTICQTGALSVTRREFTRLIVENSGKVSNHFTQQGTLHFACRHVCTEV